LARRQRPERCIERTAFLDSDALVETMTLHDLGLLAVLLLPGMLLSVLILSTFAAGG
jgi:hypothetical protein